ncbi:hypothetical protein [Gelidibacter pelagius]|nr:hypothetical protein [Gelidibacter pelagius]
MILSARLGIIKTNVLNADIKLDQGIGERILGSFKREGFLG